MRREPGVEHQGAEELRREEHVVVAQHLPLGDLDMVDEVRATRDVHHRAHQRLVERHDGIAVAADAGAVAQRLRDRLPQRDAGVLDGVVAVHVQVALAPRP